jgi:hypothetical protein
MAAQGGGKLLFESSGTTPAELHSMLMFAIDHCDDAPLMGGGVDPLQGFPLSVRAAMALGMFFGREEDDNTVPRSVMVDTVTYMMGGLQGENTSNVPNVASVLGTMSISDANTGDILFSFCLTFIRFFSVFVSLPPHFLSFSQSRSWRAGCWTRWRWRSAKART